jgi:hypothetical protein
MADRMSPNQIVAINLRLARKLEGWSQEQAGKAVAPYLGEEWSKARWSRAEKADDPTSVRGFTADELVAFSLTFQRPLIWFLMPPSPMEEESDAPLPALVGADDNGVPLNEYLDLLYVADPGLGGMKERVLALSDFLGWDLRARLRIHMTPVWLRAREDIVGDLFGLYGDIANVARKLESWSGELRKGAYSAEGVEMKGDEEE